MVIVALYRLFYNCIFAYILIYIDLVIPNWTTGPNNNRRIILICIGFYSTSYFLLKAVFAFYHQIKWILQSCSRSCCVTPLFEGRIDRVRDYWARSDAEYLKKIGRAHT
jgi:hypothetical protein